MRREWNKIINDLRSNPRDLQTLPTNNSRKLWFFVYTDGEKIYVEQSKDNFPSSKISSRRVLDYATFEKMHPIYLRRKKGESVSSEASKISMNQSYWYPVMKSCLED